MSKFDWSNLKSNSKVDWTKSKSKADFWLKIIFAVKVEISGFIACSNY
jgi:hypothetical protein